MRRYILLQGLYLSFYSRDFYRDVAHNWQRTAFVFLILLALLITLRITFLLEHNLGDIYRNHAPGYLPQLPEIIIEDGVARTKEEIVWPIYEPKTGHLVGIIDTTREQADPDVVGHVLFYLSSHEFAYRRSADDIRTFKLKRLPDTTINRHKARVYLSFVSNWLTWVLFLPLWFVAYFVKLAHALLLGMIGTLACKLFNVTLSLPALMAMAIMATTPAVIIEFLISLQKTNFVISWWISSLIALGFLIYGIRANLQPLSGPEVKPDIRQHDQ